MRGIKTFAKYIGSIWEWLGASSPDEIMENNYESFGVEDPYPVWHKYFSKFSVMLFIGLAITIPVILYIKFGTSEGSNTLIYLLLVVSAPFLLLIRLLAVAHKKYRFAKSLPEDSREKYISLLNNRKQKFLKVFIIIFIATALFIIAILLVDKSTSGRGWF